MISRHLVRLTAAGLVLGPGYFMHALAVARVGAAAAHAGASVLVVGAIALWFLRWR